jgi:hypothetical protein
MAKFATKTNVDAMKSQMEIQRILARYGCDNYAYMTQGDHALIGFRAHQRQIKMVIKLPTLEESSRNKAGAKMAAKQAHGAWEQQVRQRWRALALVVKAKLEAVESGVATFEEEFLPYILLPGGKTVAQEVVPKIAEAYAKGKGMDTPLLLTAG